VNYCLLRESTIAPWTRERWHLVARVGRAQLNLIPYNPGSAPVTRAPTIDETEGFAALLAAEGVDTRCARRAGSRIMAGCGQLGGGGGP